MLRRLLAWFAREIRSSWSLQAGLFLSPLLLAGVIGFVGGLVLSPREASKEFYSAVAGIIPVLLLTLAVQARFFELPTVQQIRAQVSRIAETEVDTDDISEAIEQLTRPTRRLAERIAFGVALLGVLVAAEFAALHPLATGEPKDGNPDVVYIALASGFLLIGGLH